MSELLAFTHLVTGGFVAGKAVYLLVDDLEEGTKAEDYMGGLLVLTFLAWAAWPVAWGIMRAHERAAARQ